METFPGNPHRGSLTIAAIEQRKPPYSQAAQNQMMRPIQKGPRYDYGGSCPDDPAPAAGQFAVPMNAEEEKQPLIATTSLEDEAHTNIQSASDVLTARQMVRYRATALGFDSPNVTLLAAAISEVARNIIDHANAGELIMRIVKAGGRRGLEIIARDRGPGIPDVAHATQFGHSARRGLGVGLPGAKLLVDEFDIQSMAGRGTTVTMTKWLPA